MDRRAGHYGKWPRLPGWRAARTDGKDCGPLIDVLNEEAQSLAKPVEVAHLRELKETRGKGQAYMGLRE
ncbi:hypothetical protein AB0892_08045 [Streptomyces sp. NPDC005409]|uniref:hypothetical protein n=1 Tax=Streptomyces sp. NPDC005409 TaxID=3155342 RepID=UPI00345127A7